MTGDVVDRRPARTTAILAAVLAAAVATLVGRAAGFGAATAFVVLGSSLLALGAWGIEEPARTRQAGGSVAATVGSALLFGLFVLAGSGVDGWILIALCIGLALVAVDAAIGFDWERVRSLTSVLAENGKVVFVGFVCTALASLLITYRVVVAVVGVVFAVSTSTPLAGFVTLQLFALCVAVAIPRAVSTLESWATEDGDADDDVVPDSVESAGIRLEDVPRVYWVALAAQLVAALVPQATRLFRLFVGDVVGAVLTSGVLHGLLGIILGVLLLVYLAAFVRWLIVVWFGAVPAQTLAVQAGGIASILVAVLVGVVFEYLPDSRVLDLLAPLVVGRYSVVGFPPVALAGLGVALLVVVLLLECSSTVALLGAVPDRATGFALGSALLFVASLGAAVAGVPAFVVFVGVGGALLTWDLGSHASSVGWQLGQAAVTRRSEFVHVTGSTLVLAVAVAFATLAYYVVPATTPAGTGGTSGLAALSVILVLVALLAFVAAVHLRGRATGN